MPKKNLKKTKAILGFVASFTVGTVAGAVLRAYIPVDANKITKISYQIGTYVIAGMAGEAATKYTERTVDSIVNGVEQAQEEIEKNSDGE